MGIQIFKIINTNMITILKKIINDYCKLTNNNDIKTTIFINTLLDIKYASSNVLFGYYLIIKTIYGNASKRKNFNSEILLKICKKNLDLWYYKEFDNFLIRHQIKSSFVENIKQSKNQSLTELMLLIQPANYINYAFCWAETKEKHAYWYKYDRIWRKYLNNKRISLDETQQLNRQQIYNDICDFLSNKNILGN